MCVLEFEETFRLPNLYATIRVLVSEAFAIEFIRVFVEKVTRLI